MVVNIRITLYIYTYICIYITPVLICFDDCTRVGLSHVFLLEDLFLLGDGLLYC